MKYLSTIFLFVVAIPVFGQNFENFITVSGNKLMDGDKEFRFISFNIPNLNYVEDDMTFTRVNPYDLPTEFEMRDAFETIREMGGRVIRIYTIPVRNNNFPKEAPTFVEGPGQFNEDAFKANDMMLALANEYQIRIIFSLLNNWQWMGGVPNYAEFRGKKFEDFWTDPQLIKDFKKTIKFTLNRENTITGVHYKDDKSILCWETGNELQCPHEWTSEIVKYIKRLDNNHLVLDGYFAIDDRPIREESILDPNIDIVSSHHYEKSPFNMRKNIRRNMDVVKGRKPYLVGEFGFETTTALESVLDLVIENAEICGALTWSLRYRHRNGGFYWHSEPLGLGIYKSFHWPGFMSGQSYDEKNFMQMYRRKAFEIQKIEEPPVTIPGKPFLLAIKNVYEISWQGSMGAERYLVERAESVEGPWNVVAHDVCEARNPYFPLFQDKSANIGAIYYYRIKAMNASGISDPSNIVGPVLAKYQALIDNMENYGMQYISKDMLPITGNDRSYKEILHRMKSKENSEMVYKVPGSFDNFRVYTFEQDGSNHIVQFHGSIDGEIWNQLNVTVNVYSSGELNYEYWHPKIYSYSNKDDLKFLKVVFKGDTQVARVEIVFN